MIHASGDGYYVLEVRDGQELRTRGLAKGLFSRPCYSCGRDDHTAFTQATNKDGESIIVHSCPVSACYGSSPAHIGAIPASEWKRRLLVNVTSFVKFYDLNKEIIKKALEIYTRNEIGKRPVEMSEEQVSKHDRQLAWLSYHANNICEILAGSRIPPQSDLEAEASRELQNSIVEKKWRGNRTLAPCRNCAALDHGKSAISCPWQTKRRGKRPNPQSFALYWNNEPKEVSKALDRYMLWGQGARLKEEHQFQFRYDVMQYCSPKREEFDTPMDILQAEVSERLLNRAGVDCRLCGGRDHSDGTRDKEGKLICPFSFEAEPGSRWPDPKKILLASGFKEEVAKQIIHNFYLRGRFYFDTRQIDALVNDASEICHEANNLGFKRTTVDRDYCLIEDGSDEEEPNDS